MSFILRLNSTLYLHCVIQWIRWPLGCDGMSVHTVAWCPMLWDSVSIGLCGKPETECTRTTLAGRSEHGLPPKPQGLLLGLVRGFLQNSVFYRAFHSHWVCWVIMWKWPGILALVLLQSPTLWTALLVTRMKIRAACPKFRETNQPWSFPLCSVQFSCSVMSDSLRPHGHTRPPCPSPTPRARSNSCPSSQWCHPTIPSSVITFSSCFQSFPASESFPMGQFFPPGGQSTGVSASAPVLMMNIQDWFPLGWTGLISLQSKGLSWVFKSTVQKHQFFGTQLSL